MADTTRIVRRNNNVLIDWVIQNWQPKTPVGLTVDKDPGAGFGTVAVAEAPDASTKSNGTGRFLTVMPQLGTFVFTLTVKKKKGDELSKTTVIVEELQYKSFKAAADKVELGSPVTLSWQLEAFEGCTFRLAVTDPSGAETQSDVKTDAKGAGTFKVTPAVVGTHKFRLLAIDPTLKEGQTSPKSPEVSVLVKDHPVLKSDWSGAFNAAKPVLKLVFAGTAATTPPAFHVNPDPNPTFKPTVGELKPAADNATSGDWEADVEVPPGSKAVAVKIFRTLAEAKGKAKSIAHADLWFQKGSPPRVMSTPAVDRSGKLGTPNMDGAKLGGLSAKRQKVLRDFLTQVLPSTVGSAAFDKLETKASVDANVKKHKEMTPPRTYTTCGTVPSFLAGTNGFNEKVHNGRKIGGLIGCYWAATTEGAFAADKPAWVTAEGNLQPKPGDIFLIAGKAVTPDTIKNLKPKIVKGERTDAFEILHVGIVVDPDPGEVTAGGQPIFIVGEAGQGTQEEQKALYDRPVFSLDEKGFPMLGGRRLAGWVDIDSYLHWT